MSPLAITYAAGNRLWLIVLVAALAAIYVAVQLARPKVVARFTNLSLLESVMPKRRDWRRHVGAVCFLLGMSGLVFGLAHPQRSQRVPTNRGTVMLAIDTSLSMAATDVSPDRLDAAKEAAKLFLDNVPPKFNVGIVSFNGSAAVLVEPTLDRDLARRAVDGLELGQSTAIGEGIFASLAAIKTLPPARDKSPVPARIVLMSDGATQAGRSNQGAVAAAVQARVPIDTIAFGTDHGVVTIPESHALVPVTVDRAALAQIARSSGGHAYTAASEAQIRAVYSRIGTSIGYRTVRKDISGWFVGIGFVLLLGAAAANLAWQDRML
jgi:Ca-activated chloride channel family protein